ncbi:hypothetical protein B5X24_HaOG211127, partial [Helicoverpa armigera]
MRGITLVILCCTLQYAAANFNPLKVAGLDKSNSHTTVLNETDKIVKDKFGHLEEIKTKRSKIEFDSLPPGLQKHHGHSKIFKKFFIEIDEETGKEIVIEEESTVTRLDEEEDNSSASASASSSASSSSSAIANGRPQPGPKASAAASAVANAQGYGGPSAINRRGPGGLSAQVQPQKQSGPSSSAPGEKIVIIREGSSAGPDAQYGSGASSDAGAASGENSGALYGQGGYASGEIIGPNDYEGAQGQYGSRAAGPSGNGYGALNGLGGLNGANQGSAAA